MDMQEERKIPQNCREMEGNSKQNGMPEDEGKSG